MEKAKRNIKAKGAAKKGAKVSKPAVTKAAETKAETVAVETVSASKGRGMVAYANNQASPYAGLAGVAKGAYTLAALIVSGLVKKEGESYVLTNGGSLEMMKQLTHLPNAYHRANGNFVNGKLTKDGLNWFAQRTDHKGPTYNTMRETVDSFVDAMTKSGTRNCEGRAISFTKKVIVD